MRAAAAGLRQSSAPGYVALLERLPPAGQDGLRDAGPANEPLTPIYRASTRLVSHHWTVAMPAPNVTHESPADAPDGPGQLRPRSSAVPVLATASGILAAVKTEPATARAALQRAAAEQRITFNRPTPGPSEPRAVSSTLKARALDQQSQFVTQSPSRYVEQ